MFCCVHQGNWLDKRLLLVFRLTCYRLVAVGLPPPASCCAWPMAAHPLRATEELLSSSSATATGSTKSGLWRCVCFSVQVYGVLPSALQHQFRLLLWEERQLLWLWGGCSEGGVSPAQSQDRHDPHQPSGQSLLLVPGQSQEEIQPQKHHFISVFLF